MFSSVLKKSKIFLFAVALFLCGGVAVSEQNNKGDAVKLPTIRRTYFYTIDSSILEGVEIGSPESIRNAMHQMRKSKEDYDENEKVLIAVAAKMMEMAWPSERVTWDVFPVSENNPYMGALNSAKQGVFDSSTGNVDFLSTLLPAFVLLENSDDSSLYGPCDVAISEALEKRPDSVIASYLMALLQEKLENYDVAESYLADIYKKCPQVKEIALAYTRVLRLNGKAALSSDILSSVSADANDIEVLKQNAYTAFEMKDYSSAEYYVARVLQQTPNDLDFVLFRAKILIEKNDYIHAVSLLDMYSRHNNTSLEYLLLRAKVQLDWSKNTKAATETIEKALNLYPDSMEALLIAAKISSITEGPVGGFYSDDLAAIVLAIDPDNMEAMNYALDGLIQKKNWSEAYSVCKKLIEKEDVSSDIVYKYVTICIELGKKQEAYDYAKKIHDKNPDDEQVLFAYVLAYSEIGDKSSVIKYINSLLPTASQKVKSYLLYRRSFLQKSEDDALADLRSSLISNPRNSEALFRLYELYYKKGDYRKAQYYLRQVVAINPNDSSLKKLNEELTKKMMR